MLAGFLLTACARPTAAPRMVVLGVDGMDPAFLESHWSQLPNLHRFRAGFTPLRTTNPPQSPVAWSTFSTGLPPGEHGIFDFVHRDPTTHAALSSFGLTEPPRFQIPFGPWLLPLSPAHTVSFRRGTTFWELLSRAGIPVQIYRMPVNYPPIEAGEALSGMGTPDLEGTFGTFTLYTDDPFETTHEVSGGRFVRVDLQNGRAILPVHGPPDPYRPNQHRPDDHRLDQHALTANLTLDVDPVLPLLRIRTPTRAYLLQQGEWSPWISLELGPVHGMFRLYASSVHSNLRLYRSPLNIDPAHPDLLLSHPAKLSAELSRLAGPFYTQGIPEDSSAVRQGALRLPEYLAQSDLVQAESRRLLDAALARFHSGFLFFYFSEIDQNSHLLWGHDDETLLRTYQAVDRAIGHVLDTLPDADVIVMSDHGFARFDTAVDLNAWFQTEHIPAQAMGLNAVYLEHPDTAAEVMRKLLAWRDPVTGHPVIATVARVPKSWSKYAPDLTIGYAAGYRAAWETAMGNTGGMALRPNLDPWLADHCIDPALVPGVLLTHHPLLQAHPGLEDLPVTILNRYGVTPEPAMKGNVLWRKQ